MNEQTKEVKEQIVNENVDERQGINEDFIKGLLV